MMALKCTDWTIASKCPDVSFAQRSEMHEADISVKSQTKGSYRVLVGLISDHFGNPSSIQAEVELI